MLAPLVARSLRDLIRLLTGARALWRGAEPSAARRVYFANHASHGDFVLIWSSLPRLLRAATRPVAAAEYWSRGAIRRYLIGRVFHGVLVERDAATRCHDPLQTMCEALDAGASLILFPEGTRNQGEGLLPFKSGLYHLARLRPEVEFVPVWIDNLKRVMPKGHGIPLPLLCTVTFGPPLRLAAGEDKAAFLDRSRRALLALGEEAAT